jgi:hypothetical protein
MMIEFELENRPKQQPGAKKDKEVAAKVVAELEKIAQRHAGRLTPDDVLAVAKNPRSVLHDHFEWDDSEAAALWRREQARSLIASVRVRYIENDAPSEPLRYFVNVPLKSGEHYMNARVAFADSNLRQIILARAMAELQSMQRRYGEIEELAALWGEFEKIKA